MPYTTDNPPEQLKGLPQGLIRQWVTVFNGLVEEAGEDSARKQAWGAVKKSWEQGEDGKWVRKKSDHGEMIHDVEIMRSGTHTSSTGQEVTFTDEDLERIAERYDIAYHESPVVVGHPTENGPAYGWVKSLKAAGGKLLATLDLVPEFVEAVRQGLFKKRSASIYNNLDGKGAYLRHVGFLGAVPPAVKALSDIALTDGNESTTVEFSNKETSMSWKDWFKKAIDEMPEDGGGAPEPKATQFSEEEVKAREEAAAEAAAKKAREEVAAEFAEKQMRDQEEAAIAAHKADITTRLDALVKSGKVTPAQIKGGLAEFAETLVWRQSNDGGTLINFSEDKKGTPYEWFMAQLESSQPQVHFGEVAGNDKDVGNGGAAERFGSLVNKIMEEKNVGFSVAFAEAQMKNPDLARQYQAELQP